MRYNCWALQTANGFVRDLRDPLEGFKTLTFKTKISAEQWAARNDFYRAKPVKISITVLVKDF